VALLLQKNGIMRVRPLKGGIAAWQDRGYPFDALPQPIKNHGPLQPTARRAE